MRLSLVRPNEVRDAQRPVYEACERVIEGDGFEGFESRSPDGEFLGPWAVMMHFPDVALAFGRYVEAVGNMHGISDSARQVVILTVGGRFNAAYELYAHSAVAARAGLRQEQIATLSSGGRPVDLTTEQALVAEVATALLRGGVLPAPTYDAVVASLGQAALDTIVFVTIHYFAICTMLNAYDVPPGAPTSWLADAADATPHRK